jgi:uncharacterized protein
MNTISFAMAFIMGLTGSLHCAGMCGPIVWVMPFNQFNGVKKWVGIFLYHLGRISVYALLAMILHSFKTIFNPQWQQYISIALGASLLIAGLLSFVARDKWKINLPWSASVMRSLSWFMGNPKLFPLFLTGALNGLLPCGLVYMALSVAVSAPAVLESVMLMYAFGIGTMPMLISLSMLKNRASFIRFSAARKFVPLVLFAFGCLFVIRGMNLGVPYLSPRISMENQVVKASCCHK